MKRRSQSDSDRDLLALVCGELDGERERELRRQLAGDERLRSELERLEGAWNCLELPPVDTAPPGFAVRVTARAFEEDAGVAPSWFRDTLLGRLASAAALAGGIVLGALVAYPRQSTTESVDLLSVESSLAESYWQAITDTESDLWTGEQP